MNETNSNLTKSCSVCGQLKPLNAFLEWTDSDGTNYGTVCSTCRRAYIAMLKEGEEGTHRKAELSIGAEERLALELEIKKLDKEEKERNERERKELEERDKSKSQRVDNLADKDRKRRENLRTPSSFLDRKPETPIEKTFGYQEAQENRPMDLSVTVQDTQIPKIKNQSSEFNRFKTWLGKPAPINRNVEKKMKEAPKDQTVIDYVNKTFKNK